jgi:AcrR family transcriptional regulator
MSRMPSKPDRRAALLAALDALQCGQQKVSISAVARKAGVTPALIHNTYPDVAQQIRAATGRDAIAVRGQKDQELQALQASNKRLHQENTQLTADVARLASIVQTLTDEVARLRAVSAGKVIDAIRPTRP